MPNASSPKPILQNLKFDVTNSGAILLATDLEVGIRIQVAGVQTEVAGSAPPGGFGSILRVFGRLAASGIGRASDAGSRRAKRVQAAGRKPPGVSLGSRFQRKRLSRVVGAGLRELIRRTIFATDNESSRYALGGVLLEMGPDKIIGVGTDGRRLAKMEVPAQSVNGHSSGRQDGDRADQGHATFGASR